MASKPHWVSLAGARSIWLRAQRLDTRDPFGAGPAATLAAIEHLGYVQIDTINVVERSHHHILFSRIPAYRRADLRQAQAVDKTVFEYWTHALSYVPMRDFRYYVPDMKAHRQNPTQWAATVPDSEVQRVLRLVRREGAISIRDIDDDVLIDKTHPWGSRKPSKGALQRAFYDGRVTVSERLGIIKTYELMERHFGWRSLPRAATTAQIAEYRLDRALRAQGLVSAASVMYPKLRFASDIAAIVARRERRGELVAVTIEDDPMPYWAAPETLDQPAVGDPLVHILSPFDPLIIQRRRLQQFFGYEHVFEAYVPKARRRFGYFALPVLVSDTIVAALDLKADREARRLLVQSWHWLAGARPRTHKPLIEAELDRFSAFQFGD